MTGIGVERTGSTPIASLDLKGRVVTPKEFSPGEVSEVIEAAERVLAANWRSTHTVPAAGLYPHQWSWDSAFISFGTRHSHPANARLELETLFAAQWHDGRVPQIVYTPGGDYSPGTDFWGGRNGPLPSAPLIQPPMHAWAVLATHEADPEGSRGTGFLERHYPALVRWHRYLDEHRTVDGRGLAVIVHPWESGLDNSPLWDFALARIEADQSIAIPRPDLDHAAAGERPTDRDYARYFTIAAAYRDQQFDDDFAELPFAMEDPAFTAIWARSERALAAIAVLIGNDPGPHSARAAAFAVSLEQLWDARLGCYTARDIHTGELAAHRTISGILPLLVGGAAHADELLDLLGGPSFGLATALPPSNDLGDPTFDRASYWRGPAWVNTAWLLAQALRELGHDREADGIATQVARLALAGNFSEYFDPLDGSPRGTRDFSWTAALAIDLLTPTIHSTNTTENQK